MTKTTKSYLVAVAAFLLTLPIAYAATISALTEQDATKTGLQSLMTKVNANFTGITNGTIAIVISGTLANFTGLLSATNSANLGASTTTSLSINGVLTCTNIAAGTMRTNAIPFLGATTNLLTNTWYYTKVGSYWLVVTNIITP